MMGSIYKRTWNDKRTGKVVEGDTYWISYHRDGTPYRQSAGTASLSEARDALNRKEGDIAKGIPVSPKMGRMKYSELAADVVNDYRVNAKRSLHDLETRLKDHILPFFGEARASSITMAEIRKYIDRRQGEQASNATINRELTAIKRAFTPAAR